MSCYLVGIAGGTASGKTTLAKLLAEKAGQDRAGIIELDRYYRSQDHLSPQQRALVNYDHPNALEFTLLEQNLKELCKGHDVHLPIYDFTTHCKAANQSTLIQPKAVIIVEGILTFAEPSLCDLFSKKIFVEACDDVRLARRIERDTRERGRTYEDVIRQWNSTVQPMHLEFCQPGKELAGTIVNGESDFSQTLDALWDDIWTAAKTA